MIFRSENGKLSQFWLQVANTNDMDDFGLKLFSIYHFKQSENLMFFLLYSEMEYFWKL